MLQGLPQAIAALFVTAVVFITVNKMLGTSAGGNFTLPGLPRLPSIPNPLPSAPPGSDTQGLCFLPGPGYNMLNQNEADCKKYGGHWVPLHPNSQECRNHLVAGDRGFCDAFGHWHATPF